MNLYFFLAYTLEKFFIKISSINYINNKILLYNPASGLCHYSCDTCKINAVEGECMTCKSDPISKHQGILYDKFPKWGGRSKNENYCVCNQGFLNVESKDCYIN